MAKSELVPYKRVESAIVIVRGQRVMLDAELAALYGVDTKVLNQAVKRNIERFPDDFMFQLTKDEAGSLRSLLGDSVGSGGRATFHMPSPSRASRCCQAFCEVHGPCK